MEAGCRDRDIDRGWAWVVMGATYLGQMMFATSYFMVGVVYVELLEHYQDDEVKTSLVGTLNMAIYALLGELVSVCLRAPFYCRARFRRVPHSYHNDIWVYVRECGGACVIRICPDHDFYNCEWISKYFLT